MAPAGGPRAKKGILERLDSGEVVVGDGSFLITLEKRGFVKAGLWTPEAVVEHPSAVRQLHTEFLRAGADVLQTFTFSATEDNMESKWEAVNAAACDLAREVADGGDALVAGGLCQTSLYKYHKDETRIKNLFRRQLEVFVRKNVDFLIAEYFEHVEEAVWAVEVLREVGKPVAATMCIGPEGDMHDVTPGDCAVKLVRAGANIIGVNCRFGPRTSLQTIKLMKEGLRDSGLQTHLMVQSLGFHTPDCGKGGFVDLPEYPFSMEPRVATRWDIQKYAREAYDLGVRYIGGCCGFEPYHIRAIAEELAPERGFLPPASEKHGSWGSGLNMHTKPWIRARYKVNTLACTKTVSLGSRKPRLDGNTGRICCQLQAGLSVLRSQSQMHKKQRKKTLKRQTRKNRSQALSSLLLASACPVFQLLSIDELLSLRFKQHVPPKQTRQMLWRCGGS